MPAESLPIVLNPCPATAWHPPARCVEPSHVAAPCRPRQPDSYEPARKQGLADEHIPGRLPFDLYLTRSNRDARAAERTGRPDPFHPQRHRLPCCHAAPGPGPASSADDAIPRLGTSPTPTPPPARPSQRPALQLIATRRGSILDVLA